MERKSGNRAIRRLGVLWHSVACAAKQKLSAIPIASDAPTPHVHGPGCKHDH